MITRRELEESIMQAASAIQARDQRISELEGKWWAGMHQMYQVACKGALVQTLIEHIEPECYEDDYRGERP